MSEVSILYSALQLSLAEALLSVRRQRWLILITEAALGVCMVRQPEWNTLEFSIAQSSLSLVLQCLCPECKIDKSAHPSWHCVQLLAGHRFWAETDSFRGMAGDSITY